MLGLTQFQSFLNNILTIDITLIQCKINPIIMTKFESIVFYQAPFCLQAPNWALSITTKLVVVTQSYFLIESLNFLAISCNRILRDVKHVPTKFFFPLLQQKFLVPHSSNFCILSCYSVNRKDNKNKDNMDDDDSFHTCNCLPIIQMSSLALCTTM